MTNERQAPKDEQIKRAIVAGDFRRAVGVGLVPVVKERKSGFVELYVSPKLLLSSKKSLETDDVRYLRYSKYDGTKGIHGLDFVPTHAMEITTKDEVFGNSTAQVMFGLRSDDVVVRAYLVITPDGGTYLTRELNLEESRALVDFVNDPVGNYDQRDIILRLTEDEERSAHVIQKDGADFEERMVEKEIENEGWHKKAQNGAQDLKLF
jgi:hypothetical protein